MAGAGGVVGGVFGGAVGGERGVEGGGGGAVELDVFEGHAAGAEEEAGEMCQRVIGGL
ncbi:MAG: hypothetical protein R3F65_21020 [bacterium]